MTREHPTDGELKARILDAEEALYRAVKNARRAGLEVIVRGQRVPGDTSGAPVLSGGKPLGFLVRRVTVVW
jgi:hypothetical protein